MINAPTLEPPKANWEVKTLREVCRIKPPKAEAKQKLRQEEMVSFVPMNDLKEVQKNFAVEQEKQLGQVYGGYTYFAENDVLLAKITPCFENGKLGIARDLINGIGFGSSEFVVFRSSDNITPEYLFYFLSRDTFRIEGKEVMTGAVGHKRVPKEFIENYRIPVPPIAEQERIVGILDEAFEGIAAATAQAEKNLHNARELFQSVLQSTFSQKGDDWEEVDLLTLLERGWISSHLDGNHGSNYPRKAEFIEEGIPYISANCIKDETVDFSLAKYLSSERAASLRKGIAQDRDVLFAHNATVGPVAILQTEESKILLSTSLTYYRCNQEFILPEYLAHYMRSYGFKSQYLQIMEQSTRNQVPITKQREFFHLIPPIPTQQAIVEKLDALSEETKRLEAIYERKKAALSELKQSLLQKAFAGEL